MAVLVQWRCTATARAVLCACTLMVAGSPSASGAEAPSALSESIPQQPLAEALAAYARQTGLQLVYVSEIARGGVSKGAPAGLAPDAALSRLLEGTGLRFAFLNARSVRIFAPAAASPAAGANGAAAEGPHVKRRAPWRSEGLEEVRVTAQRDPAGLGGVADVQKVSASVTIVDRDTLIAQHAEQLTDYSVNLPGVAVLSSGAPGESLVIIRGVSPLTEAPPVAFYLDDIPIGGSASVGYAGFLSLDLLPYDLERLEVWRGPQGTFQGAESEIGLIRYVFTPPSVSDFEARVGADVSTIHAAARAGASLRAAINAPILQGRLGIRASVYDSYAPGYVDNLYSGVRDINAVRQRGGRISARWQPDETLSATVNAFWQRIAAESVAEVSPVGASLVPHTGDAYFVQPTRSYGDLVDRAAFLSPLYKSLDLYSASVNWNPAALEVHSATGWSRAHAGYAIDSTQIYGSYFAQWSGGSVPPGLSQDARNLGLEKFSEELRIRSREGGRLGWLLGGFYTRESSTDYFSSNAFDKAYHAITAFAPCLYCQTLRSTFKARALFADVTWQLTERIGVAAGIRHSHDAQEFTVVASSWSSPTGYDFGHSSESATTWTGSASYQVTPDVMLYGRVASGFQPGGPQGSSPGVPQSVKGERLTNYESGFKAEFFERKARVDLSVFYIDWKDLQIGVSNGIAGFLANAGRATSRGFEFISSWAPRSGLLLAYNAAYTQAALDSVLPEAAANLTGYQIANVPKWSMGATADYAWTPTGSWQAHVGTGFRWIGQEWSEFVQSRSGGGYPGCVVHPYWVLDVNAGIARGPLALRLFIRNVTDTRAYPQSFPLVDASGVPTQIIQKLLQPRTLGVGLEYTL